jgi:hypothetical protein
MTITISKASARSALLRLSPWSAKVNADNYAWLARVCCASLQSPRFLQVLFGWEIPTLILLPTRSITGGPRVKHASASPSVSDKKLWCPSWGALVDKRGSEREAWDCRDAITMMVRGEAKGGRSNGEG